MKTKILYFLLVILLFEFSFADINSLEGTEIPKEIKGLVGNQKVNLYLDESFFLAFEIKEGKIYKKSDSFQKPSLEIYVKNETITKIISSENPQRELLNAYKSGEIRVVKRTLKNKIKFWLARFFVK